jgi:hypothetical protein
MVFNEPVGAKVGGGMISKDYQALSLFRIVFSMYLLSDFLIASYPFFNDFYDDAGILPVTALAAEVSRPGIDTMLPIINILNHVQSPILFAIFYLTALIAFALGYRTRVSNVLVFIGNSYMYWRNPYLNSGAETLARLLLLWSIFLPMGRYWGIDAALDRAPRDRSYPLLPFLALRVQIASLYVFSALFKIAGIPWRRGVALSWALSDNVFGGTFPSLFLLEHFPWLPFFVNYSVIGLQLAFPFLIYCPWRNDFVRAITLVASAAMHLSFILFMNVGGFPYLCVIMLLLLVPDSWIERFLDRRRERLAKVAIYYEPDCSFCERVSLILREFLLCPMSMVLPASADPKALGLLLANNSWVVRGADGKTYLKSRAMGYLFKQNPLFVPISKLFERKEMLALFDRFYDRIGSNRRRLAPLAKALLPLRSDRSIGRSMLVLCAILMTLAITSNISSVARLKFPSLSEVGQVTAALQVRQEWTLFAPTPTRFIHEYRVVVHNTDGTTTDLMRILPMPLFRSNAHGGLDFASPRWAKYFTRFEELTEPAWLAFGHYLCARAQAQLGLQSIAREVEITATMKPAVEGTPPAAQPEIFRQFACLSHSAWRKSKLNPV